MITALLFHANGRIEMTGLLEVRPLWRKPIPNKTSFAFASTSALPSCALMECLEFKLTSNSEAWPIYEEIVREDGA